MSEEKQFIVTASQLYDLVDRIVLQRLAKLGLAGFDKVTVTSASGNPAFEIAGETSTTRGDKTHLILQPGPPAQNAIGMAGRDQHDNRFYIGKLVNAADYVSDATTLRGVGYVIPGDTVHDSANTERSSSSTSYVTVKRFLPAFPGTYRLTFELKRDAAGFATASAQVVILTASGDVIPASTEATETTSSYVAKTLNMTVDVKSGQEVGIQIKTDDGTRPAWVQNVALKYAVATANPVISHTVLQD